MQDLILADLDDSTLNDLREGGAKDGRTPAEEAKAILADALAGKQPNPCAPADAIFQRLSGTGKSFTDSAESLREDRDR
jgi:plasmid stability protein